MKRVSIAWLASSICAGILGIFLGLGLAEPLALKYLGYVPDLHFFPDAIQLLSAIDWVLFVGLYLVALIIYVPVGHFLLRDTNIRRFADKGSIPDGILIGDTALKLLFAGGWFVLWSAVIGYCFDLVVERAVGQNAENGGVVLNSQIYDLRLWEMIPEPLYYLGIVGFIASVVAVSLKALNYLYAKRRVGAKVF